MKKIILLVLVCLSVNTTDVYAQVESPRKNAVKINILPPLLSSTGEISYERLVKPNLSVVLGVGGNFRADKSDFQLSDDANLKFLNRDIQNRYVLAEVRRYIDFCNCEPPHGFYTGGFLRYNSLKYSASPHFENEGTSLDFDLNIDAQSWNFGALLGYQINLKNWIVDFEFAGIGYAPNWINFNTSSELSSEALTNLSNTLSDNFGIEGANTALDLSSSSTEINFWAYTFRYAVSVGYNF